jgi:hypothetical protein
MVAHSTVFGTPVPQDVHSIGLDCHEEVVLGGRLAASMEAGRQHVASIRRDGIGVSPISVIGSRIIESKAGEYPITIISQREREQSYCMKKIETGGK